MTRPAQFDVFLCHNSEDKLFIRDIARKLRGEKLTPWLDEEQLRGGDVWSEVVDDISQEIKTVAVFVGRNGFGPWQKAEISGFLHDCVERDIRVIPVLLDNAPPGNPRLPFFLRGRIWIDFRQPEPDPFELLFRGITGRQPDPTLPRNSPIEKASTPKQTNTSTVKTFSFEVVTVNTQGKIVQQQTQSAQFFTEDLGNGVTLDMVAIPGGSFQMGSPDSEAERRDSESPQHFVKIAPFHMGKFAVTQAQYQAIMGNNPSHFKGENRPVEQVSWKDAIAFCQRLSKKTGNLYRLPSEAEWEYACRAGTTTPFHFGEAIATDLANYDGKHTYGQGIKGTYRAETISVGSFPANAFGLYDMHGNVWEWCADHWHENYKGAPTDGSAWLGMNENANRVRRGGSWILIPGNCRSASRFFHDAWFRNNNYFGFRVVCSAPRT
jgi:formylglycine-generating enzyme required for sulfatase activity